MAEDIVLQVPVNGMGPVDVTMQDPPPGAWEAEVTDIAVKTKQGEGGGKTSIHITVNIVEPGPAQGISTMGFIGTDWSKDFNVKHFVNLFTGIMEKLGKMGDFDDWQILSEFTMEMRGYNLNQHGMFGRLT